MNNPAWRPTWADVEKLKSEGRYRHAGALAFILGYDDDYGCHFGMRSTYLFARGFFKAGWRDAEQDYSRAGV